MNGYLNILVVFDGALGSDAAVGHAISLARAGNARIDLLVIKPPTGAAIPIGGEIAFWGDAGEEVLSGALEKIPPDIGMTYRLVPGDVMAAVNSSVRRSKVDLIILTKAQKRIIGRLLGRRWRTIAADLNVPILLI